MIVNNGTRCLRPSAKIFEASLWLPRTMQLWLLTLKYPRRHQRTTSPRRTIMAEGERKDPIAKLKFLQIYSLLITPSGEEGATSSKFFDNAADLVLLFLFKDHFAPSSRCFLDYAHRHEGKLKSFLSFHLESFSSARIFFPSYISVLLSVRGTCFVPVSDAEKNTPHSSLPAGPSRRRGRRRGSKIYCTICSRDERKELWKTFRLNSSRMNEWASWSYMCETLQWV